MNTESVNKNIVQVREITASRVGGSLSSAQERFKTMKENIKKVSDGEIIKENNKTEETKEEKEEILTVYSTGEVEDE